MVKSSTIIIAVVVIIIIIGFVALVALVIIPEITKIEKQVADAVAGLPDKLAGAAVGAVGSGFSDVFSDIGNLFSG